VVSLITPTSRGPLNSRLPLLTPPLSTHSPKQATQWGTLQGPWIAYCLGSRRPNNNRLGRLTLCSNTILPSIMDLQGTKASDWLRSTLSPLKSRRRRLRNNKRAI
jgi:hypothetical protein